MKQVKFNFSATVCFADPQHSFISNNFLSFLYTMQLEGNYFLELYLKQRYMSLIRDTTVI